MAYVNSKLLISPPVFLGWGLCRGEETFPVHFGGTLRAPCSELPQSQDTPALGHKPIWLQGCDTSPGHYGLRVRIIFYFFLLLSYHLNWNYFFESQNYFFPFSFSAFILSFELEYTGELQSCWYFCFLPFQAIATSSLPHRCTHVFWRGSFSYRLLQNVVYVSLCYILGLVTF